jgi:hypothetical protein
MEEREIKEQEIVEQEDKQTKKEEIKEEKKEEIKNEKSDLMVIVEAITKGFETLGNKIDTGFEALGKKIDTGFETLGNKIDNLGTKIDTGFEALGKKIDTGFGELKDVFEKYISRENEWTSLNLYLNKINKILKDELKLKNYRFRIESEQEGADFLVKVKEIMKEGNETKEEIKAYIIIEVKNFPSDDNIEKAYNQIKKIYDDITPKEITKPIQKEITIKKGGKKEKQIIEETIIIKIPIIGAILFRFWEEMPKKLKETAYSILKEKINEFYDFHIGYFYEKSYYIIRLKEDVKGA